MGTQTQIDRLQTAKTDLKAAIESKGVTVGDVLLDAYAEKVMQITTGGGGGAYDITTTDNDDGSQNILIVDASGGGGGGATEPYIEETYNDNGELTKVSFHGHTEIRIGAYSYVSTLTDVEFSDSVTKICDSAFSGGNFQNLIIPDTVSELCQNAFGYCDNLTTVTILGNPQMANGDQMSGGASVFAGCAALTTVTIGGIGKPMDETKLPSGAFFGGWSDLTALTSITVYTEGGSALSTAPFGAPNATVTYLPA